MKREAWWKIVGHSDVKKATKDATNSDPWGPSVEQLKGLAEACYVSEDRAEVMHNLWKRLENGDPKNWRKIAKALVCLEYVMLHGPGDVVLEIRSGLYRLKPLKNFKCVDDKVDNGETVRYKVTNLLEMVGNDETVKQAREAAKRTAQRITSNSSASPINRGDARPAHYERPRDRSPPPTSDEELARKLQQQFNKEAGLPSNYTGRSAQLDADRQVTPSDSEVPGVDVLEQHRLMSQIKAKQSTTEQPPAQKQPPHPNASSHPAQGGYSSTSSWSIAPPTQGRQRHAAAQPQPQQAQQQVPPQVAQAPPQQPASNLFQSPQASQAGTQPDFFNPTPAQAPAAPAPAAAPAQAQQNLFAPQQQQQPNLFQPQVQTQQAQAQPQVQPQQQAQADWFQPQQQPAQQQTQQQQLFAQAPPQAQDQAQPQAPVQAAFDPFAPQQAQPQQQMPQAPQQARPQMQQPPAQQDFNDFFSSLGQPSPQSSQPKSPEQVAPAPVSAPVPQTAPVAPVPEQEINSPGLIEKKLMSDLDSFLTGGPKNVPTTAAPPTLGELQGSSQPAPAFANSAQYGQPTQGSDQVFHS